MPGRRETRDAAIVAHARRPDFWRAQPMVDELGPIGYVIVEFPGSHMTGEGFPLLLDLVDRGLIRILDLMFVRKGVDGTISAVELSELDEDGVLGLTIFDGASSHMLDGEDLRDAGSVLEAGSTAAIMIYENRWAAPFASALRRGGAQLVASGMIPLDTIATSLAATE
jgi:Family of unknown function (DUF6325)